MKMFAVQALMAAVIAGMFAHLACAAAPNTPRPVTVELDRVPLADALKQLEQSSGLRLAFSDDLVKSAEPVTLSAKDEPVDDVLRAILRPRGLECVYTGETMAAVVPADSDVGMAKAAGRSLRTFARLAKKLEGAVQAGDEVKVPGWTDEDDRGVAEMAIDAAGAWLFFAEQLDATAVVTRLLSAYDPDVRAGSCVSAVQATLQGRLTALSDSTALTTPALRMLSDQESAVRAAGMIMLPCLRLYHGRQWESEAQQAMTTGAKDSAPEVRMAVAAMAMLDRDCDLAFASALRSDAAAAVRCAAWAAWLERHQSKDAPRELAAAIVAEKNPIAKALCLLLAPLSWERRDSVSELRNSFECAEDGWLRVVCQVVLSGSKAKLLDTLVALTVSGKGSHQVVAAAGMVALACEGSLHDEQFRPGLPRMAAYANSPLLWARFSGIVACGGCPGAPEARLLAAMTSRDEIDRLAALLAVGERGEPAMTNGLKAALASLFDSPRYLERRLAAEALEHGSPLDGPIAAFLDEANRDPRGKRALLLLEALCKTPAMRNPSDELRARRQAVLLDAVLRSKNAALQTAFARSGCMVYGREQLVRLIGEAEPETVLALIDILSFDTLPEREAAGHAMIERIDSLFGKGGPRTAAVMGAFARFIGRSSSLLRKDEFSMPVLALLDRMLAGRVKPDAPREDVVAAGELLASLFGYGSELMQNRHLKDLPPGTRSAAASLLGYAGQKAMRHQVAELLGLCYNRVNFSNPDDAAPTLEAAMETARKEIMENGPVEDQLIVLASMALLSRYNGGNTPYERPSVELQKRLMAGDVPGRLRCKVLNAIDADDLSPEFQRYLMKRVLDRKEAVDFREQAARKLALLPQCLDELVPALVQLAGTEVHGFDAARVLGNLSTAMRYKLPRLREQNPAWLGRVAALGLAVMNDEKREAWQRESGMLAYGLAAGKQAAAALEAMALNEKLANALRVTATEAACLADPQTTVYFTLLGKYDGLKRELREQLAMRAVKMKEAPGASAFIIRYLKDPEAPYRTSVLYSDLPATPEFIEALRGLAGDKQLAPHIEKVIRHLERMRPPNADGKDTTPKS